MQQRTSARLTCNSFSLFHSFSRVMTNEANNNKMKNKRGNNNKASGIRTMPHKWKRREKVAECHVANEAGKKGEQMVHKKTQAVGEKRYPMIHQ